MITLIDYGMGNLRSVSKAVEHLGGEVKISSEPADIRNADKVILPGVGAFGDAMRELALMQLIQPIRNFIDKKKPFLGICLGLQLLFETSEESPDAQGLGVFKGSVKLFRSSGVKVPHMGWNDVAFKKKSRFTQGLAEPSFFYFVHSYYAAPQDKSLTIAGCTYGQEEFPAILGNETVFATQFHPEKSQAAGLRLLKNFIEL